MKTQVGFLPWLAIGLLAVAVGVLFVQYLVASPLRMGLYLALCLVAVVALGLILAQQFSLRQVPLAALLILGGFVAGYLGMTYVFLNTQEHRELPPVARQADGSGHTAVVYFTHGEPPAYSAMPWLETFRELDHDKASFIPTPFRPFFLSALRTKYFESGGSPHNLVHRYMIQALEDSMPEAKNQGVKFYLSFLDSNPRPDEMAIRAVNEGADKIILSAVFLTISSHTKAGQGMVQELNLAQHGVEMCMTEPLWDSAALKSMFLTRANQHLEGADKSKVGVLLVGHGQPEDWDAIYPTQTEQENLFRQEIVEMFVQDGYRRENLSLAWMGFQEPRATEVVEALVQNGVEKIFYFAASISANAIHSEYDIPTDVAAAKVPPGVELVNLGAWGPDPLVIQAIREKILACDPGLGAVQTGAAPSTP